MKQQSSDICQAVQESLTKAGVTLNLMRGGETVAKEGGAFGDATNDTELRADIALGNHFREFLSRVPGIGTITIEGQGDTRVSDGPLWITVDPLDGSLNFKQRRGGMGLPYSACVTCLKRTPRHAHHHMCFLDIVCAGVIDLRQHNLWLAEHDAWSPDDDGDFRARLDGKPCHTLDVDDLDLGSQIVIGEFYYPENREKLVKAFRDKKGWLRNPGSAAYEMALVANGTAAAFICDRQKQHELGAGYALVKGAGGVAVDWEGNDLGRHGYDFKTQTPVVLAANQKIADQILVLLHKDDPSNHHY